MGEVEEDVLTTVGEAGERALLKEIGAILGPSSDPAVVLGFGDDAAVLSPSERMEHVLTCDVQVEGIHFEPRRHGFRNWGSRAMTAALSDLAAMGASPRWCLVSLGLRQDLSLADFQALNHGLVAAADAAGAAVVGGNISLAGERCLCDVSALGEIEPGRAVARGTAETGQLIIVTGYPGRAAAGLALSRVGEPETDAQKQTVRAYLEPRARIALGRELARRRLATAMTDISDGLLRDLGNICEASGRGAVVRTSCLEDHALAEAAASAGCRAEEFLLGASDDYELLFSAARGAWATVAELAEDLGEGPLRVIGEIREGPGLFLEKEDGTLTRVEPEGWDAVKTAGEQGSEGAGEQRGRES
jgi:thiamine-monophosphate kinase